MLLFGSNALKVLLEPYNILSQTGLSLRYFSKVSGLVGVGSISYLPKCSLVVLRDLGNIPILYPNILAFLKELE